jgi:lipopolysaccharide/colanic/teichoic acid biosynthesis glycosyltransferase
VIDRLIADDNVQVLLFEEREGDSAKVAPHNRVRRVIYLDRQYIEQWSFWLDASILFRTIPAVLRRTGAF